MALAVRRDRLAHGGGVAGDAHRRERRRELLRVDPARAVGVEALKGGGGDLGRRERLGRPRLLVRDDVLDEPRELAEVEAGGRDGDERDVRRRALRRLLALEQQRPVVGAQRAAPLVGVRRARRQEARQRRALEPRREHRAPRHLRQLVRAVEPADGRAQHALVLGAAVR